MASTQDHLSIADVRNDLAVMRDGSMALIIQTTAVNFGLLSEREQLAIIGYFAAMLNSLSFSIQIIIRSKRLDVTSYLKLLHEAQERQKNPLLSEMMQRYRAFIEQTVQENDVLDKQFYIIIPLTHLELGITKDVEGHLTKAATILLPRRDHIIKQMAMVGVKSSQLDNEQIIRLFYDFYNPPLEKVLPTEIPLGSQEAAAAEASYQSNKPVAESLPQVPGQIENPAPFKPLPKATPLVEPAPSAPVAQAVAPTVPVQNPPASQQAPGVVAAPAASPASQVQSQPAQPATSMPQQRSSISNPYIVEELPDDYGAIT